MSKDKLFVVMYTGRIGNACMNIVKNKTQKQIKNIFKKQKGFKVKAIFPIKSIKKNGTIILEGDAFIL